MREDLQMESARNTTNLCSLYFDGRKDRTLVQEKVGGKLHRRSVIEEHIVVLQEPDSKYLAPVRGSAECIKQGILAFLQKEM